MLPMKFSEKNAQGEEGSPLKCVFRMQKKNYFALDILMKIDIPHPEEIDQLGTHIIIHKWDTWSMDHTLSYIIVPMLIQLKDTKHGAPNVDYDDVPEELRPSEDWIKRYNYDGETDPYFFIRWDWILDEMIWAFEQKCRDDWMEDYDYNKWDSEGAKAHQERMSNGFRLFGKYYENLWD